MVLNHFTFFLAVYRSVFSYLSGRRMTVYNGQSFTHWWKYPWWTLLIPTIDYLDHLNKLDRLLNWRIRYVYGQRKYDHNILSEYRWKLKWLANRNRRTLWILWPFLLFEWPNLPSVPEINVFLSDTHEFDLRSTCTLRLSTPLHTSSLYGDYFEVVAVRVWNDLMKGMVSLSILKSH